MWDQSQIAMKRHLAMRNGGLKVLIIVPLILFVYMLLSFNNESSKSSLNLLSLKWNSFQSSMEFHPSIMRMNHTDVIWQIPDSPKAAIFIAHGCNGRAQNFWDRTPRCPKCVGLPEERLVTLYALQQRYAVLTISSLGACWSFGREITSVKRIISWWITEHKLERLPIMALGASSGGYFVSLLATEITFSSITLMIAEGMFDSMSIPIGYPPTLFVHMPKDIVRARRIEKNMGSLKKNGIPVKEIRCMELPLSPNLFSDRIPGMDQRFSLKLFELFRENGFIDGRGYMRNDGRATQWKMALKGVKSFDRYDLLGHIQEELNLAFAYHEMTSLEMLNIFKWHDEHIG